MGSRSKARSQKIAHVTTLGRVWGWKPRKKAIKYAEALGEVLSPKLTKDERRRARNRKRRGLNPQRIAIPQRITEDSK